MRYSGLRKPTKQQESRIQWWILSALERFPFMSTVLHRLNYLVDTNSTTTDLVRAVLETGTMVINFDNVAEIEEQATGYGGACLMVGGLAFLFAYSERLRMLQFDGDVDLPKWSVASLIEITNEVLRQYPLIGELGILTREDFGGLPDDKVAEVYYNNIEVFSVPTSVAPSGNEQSSDSQQSSGGARQSSEEHDGDERESSQDGQQDGDEQDSGQGDQQDSDEGSSPTAIGSAVTGHEPQELIEQIRQLVDPSEILDHESVEQMRNQALESAKGIGDLPGSLIEQIEKALNPKVPWRQLLRRYMNRAVSSRASGHTDPSRLQRRNGVVSLNSHQRAMFYSKREQIVNIVAVRDTSGSMGKSELEAVLSEIYGIVSSFPTGTVHLDVIDFDVEAHNEHSKVNRKTISVLTDVSGRGGTDMGQSLTYIAQQYKRYGRPHIVVVLTDGMTPWPDANPVRGAVVIVCVVGNEVCDVPSWARRVDVDINDRR